MKAMVSQMARVVVKPNWVGALGSRRTHADRKIMLEAAGVAAEAIGSLRSPVGLIPSTRDPAVLAISVLAEIAEQFATDAFLPLAGPRCEPALSAS